MDIWKVGGFMSNKKTENEKYLTEQIITYIGNKRSLLDFIGSGVKIVQKDLKKDKLDIVDIFSGSGIVSRYLKKYSNSLTTNDLEDYSYILNKCYLSNKSEIDYDKLISSYNYLQEKLNGELNSGFITKLYAPKDTNNIKKGERVFYTTRNAMYIDTCRQLINELPEDIRPYFIAPLITEASKKNNTGGVFKGFYKNKSGIGQFGGDAKNALQRIMANIDLPFPLFSNYECKVINYKEDANELAKKLPVADLVYMDPPYNQHPYGSNYFMLNLISNYNEPKDVSKVSGIPKNWNHSEYNQKKEALAAMCNLCNNVNAKYILISFNSEGFISKKEMQTMLSKIGKVTTLEKKYNAYRASRNLKNRNIYVYEYLFLVKKGL